MITWIIFAMSLGLLLAGAYKTHKANQTYQFSWTGVLLMIFGVAGILFGTVSVLLW